MYACHNHVQLNKHREGCEPSNLTHCVLSYHISSGGHKSVKPELMSQYVWCTLPADLATPIHTRPQAQPHTSDPETEVHHCCVVQSANLCQSSSHGHTTLHTHTHTHTHTHVHTHTEACTSYLHDKISTLTE